MVDDNKKNYEGHGNNWHSIADFSDQELIGIAKTVCEDKDALIKKAGDFIGMISLEPPIRGMALLRKDADRNLLDSLYPFFQIGNPIEIKISEIKEWSTKGEAVIEGSVAGVSVSFFDAFYFLNKDKYKVGNTYLFNLAGLAHSFMKRADEELEFTPDQGPMKGEKINSSRMTAYMPSHDYDGEFTFCHPFTSFDGTVQAFGQTLYRYQFYIMSATENGAALSFPLFVSEKALKGYKPGIGDALTGSGWLQGYLADSLRD